MAGLDPANSGQRQMRGSSPRMTHLMYFPLDNIPMDMYSFGICSVKEAVIR